MTSECTYCHHSYGKPCNGTDPTCGNKRHVDEQSAAPVKKPIKKPASKKR